MLAKKELVNPQPLSHLHYTIHNKPSAPIEIPYRRRPVLSTSTPSPIGRPMSPDLLFEMSPISSDFSSPSRYAFRLSASREQEPFMYQFPVLSARSIPSRPRTLAAPQRTALLGMAPHSPPSPSVSRATRQHSPSRCVEDDEIIPTRLTSSNGINPTTKITGFTPMTPMQPIAPLGTRSLARPWKHRPLSPPPRSSSYSTCPWILPGKSDLLEDEISSIDADPCAFEKYLMHRIENQNPLCFQGLSLAAV